MTEHLPLFPLGSVLFPGLVLPLHIFEDRYRQLVIDLLAGPDDQPRRFGVVALREGREVGADGARALHGVGCTAELQAAEPYSDGRFDIVTTGATRFRIATLDRAGAPYLMGGVEFLDEPRGADSALLGVKVTSAFVRYRAMLGADDEAELPEDPTVLSYLVASAVIADVAGKQALLEAPDAATRLRAELRLLRFEAALMRQLPSLPAVDLVRTPYGSS